MEENNRKRDFNFLFNKMVEDDRRLSVPEGKTYISTICSTNCDTRLRLQYLGTEYTNIGNLWIGIENRIGTSIHDFYQEKLLKSGELVEIEKKLQIVMLGKTINMRVDGVFPDGRLLEIKTLGPRDYEIQNPRNKDIEQLNFYLGVSRIEGGVLSYFKRDNGMHIASFEIKFDYTLFFRIADRITKIIEGKNLGWNTDECKFCGYQDYCKGDK